LRELRFKEVVRVHRHRDDHDSDFKDIEKLGKLNEHLGPLLDTVTEKIPALLRSIRQSIYSEEAGSELGRAAGAFYKELRDSGIAEAEAMEMTRSYLRTMQDAVAGLGSHARAGYEHDEE